MSIFSWRLTGQADDLIVKNHSFVDGNKRIAAAILLSFLDRNGMLYREDKTTLIDGNTLTSLTLIIAESSPEGDGDREEGHHEHSEQEQAVVSAKTGSTAGIISKVWSFCNTLRDDSVSYGDYLEQLTYLLFLLFQYTRSSTRYPATMATRKTFSAKAKTSFFLKIEPRMIISGMLAPAPPIMRARTVPTPMPFPTRAALMGITVSALMYMGTPTNAAMGMDHGLPGPAVSSFRMG